MWEGSGLLRLPIPARPPALWSLGAAGRAQHWQLCVSVSRRARCLCPGTRLLVCVVGVGAPVFRTGFPCLLLWRPAAVLPLSAGGHAGLHVPRGLGASAGAPAGTPAGGGDRLPGERAREEGEDEGPWAGPRTGLWVVSVLGGDVAAPQCGLGRGDSAVTAALMPESRGLGTGAQGWGAAGRQRQTHSCALGREPWCRGSERLVRILLRLLIQAGYELNVQDHNGWTPLHAAAHWGVKEACSILAEALCDMDVRNKLVSGRPQRHPGARGGKALSSGQACHLEQAPPAARALHLPHPPTYTHIRLVT